MTVLGLICIAIAVGLVLAYRRQQKRVFNLKASRSVTIANMEETARAIAQDIGGGDWRDYVKLWGTIQADSPLTSQLQEQPCVSYTSRVIWEYDETVQVQDETGKYRTETKRRSETLSSSEQSIPFYLNDQTGQVLVEPEGATLELEEILNQFQPGEPPDGQLLCGAFSMRLHHNSSSTRRTLGYRYQESILPIKRSALVLGMVSDQGGSLKIVNPHQPGQHFIISLKTEGTLTIHSEQAVQRLRFGAIGCAVLGVVFLAVGLLS
jgi:hypothetical protein